MLSIAILAILAFVPCADAKKRDKTKARDKKSKHSHREKISDTPSTTPSASQVPSTTSSPSSSISPSEVPSTTSSPSSSISPSEVPSATLSSSPSELPSTSSSPSLSTSPTSSKSSKNSSPKSHKKRTHAWKEEVFEFKFGDESGLKICDNDDDLLCAASNVSDFTQWEYKYFKMVDAVAGVYQVYLRNVGTRNYFSYTMGEANVMVVKDRRDSSYWTIETFEDVEDDAVLHPEDEMSTFLCVQVEQGTETYVYEVYNEPATVPDNCRFPMLAEIS